MKIKLNDNETKGLEQFAKNIFNKPRISEETRGILEEIFGDLQFDSTCARCCEDSEIVVDWDSIKNIFERYGIGEENGENNK